MSLLNTLELRQELHLRKQQQFSKSPCLSICLYASIRLSTVKLSPLFALAQCDVQQFSMHADTDRYASEVSPPWPRQLLLPDCVRFSCCSPIVTASAASPGGIQSLDWTHPKWCKNAFSSLFQCRREANHAYSAYVLVKFAPLACWGNFTCLISFSERSGEQLFWI